MAAFQVTDVLDFVLGPVKLGQGIVGEPDHPLARFGGTDAAGGADEQLVTQLGFGLAQELGQAGLGHEQALGGPGDAFFLGQGYQVMEFVEIHGIILSAIGFSDTIYRVLSGSAIGKKWLH